MSNQNPVPRLTLGSYVKFKGVPYIAISNRDGKVKLMSVFDNRKRVVNRSNVEVMPYVCKHVETKLGGYLVTLKGHIISLTTNKVMKWADDHGTRKAILGKAFA